MPEFIERSASNYENLSKKFVQQSPDYTKQYCNIYLKRLELMTVLLEEAIVKKWNRTYPICKLYRLYEEQPGKCIIIGTIFKDQKLKPSILKQLAGNHNLTPQPIITHFTDKTDQLFIEDELQRYQIIGSLNCDRIVTGIPCALLGHDDGKGKFLVEDYLFAGYRPQIQRSIPENDTYILLLSGLDLINFTKYSITLDLFVHFINGILGELNGIQPERIQRIIIAGNCIRNINEIPKPSISMLSRKPESTDSIEAVKILDKFLLKLCSIIDVDVMPGENDPSNHILPQKPMHHCLFPESYQYKSLNNVTNPYHCQIDGVRLLGTSGQNIRDIQRYSEITDSLDCMEKLLEWNHLIPTAPDTLGCYPFYDTDPFILDDCPHVLFAGNQQQFATRQCKGPDGQQVRLIGIPEFSTTLQVCCLNLKDLECTTIKFET